MWSSVCDLISLSSRNMTEEEQELDKKAIMAGAIKLHADISPSEFANALRYAAECIEYYERVSSLGDCNDCGRQEQCEYLPKWGEEVRINCPLWAQSQDKEEG